MLTTWEQDELVLGCYILLSRNSHGETEVIGHKAIYGWNVKILHTSKIKLGWVGFGLKTSPGKMEAKHMRWGHTKEGNNIDQIIPVATLRCVFPINNIVSILLCFFPLHFSLCHACLCTIHRTTISFHRREISRRQYYRRSPTANLSTTQYFRLLFAGESAHLLGQSPQRNLQSYRLCCHWWWMASTSSWRRLE